MSSSQQRWLACAALGGLLAVALGAFAAHGLKPYLNERAQHWFSLATTYQMWHSLALFALSISWIDKSRCFTLAGWGWLLGTLLFAGSLYLMAITGNTRLAFITPIGGLCLLFGWLMLFVGALRYGKNNG